VMPGSRSDTSKRDVIASRLRARPNIGRRTAGPQFTHRGVYREVWVLRVDRATVVTTGVGDRDDAGVGASARQA
jgi:hypothetical protein